MGAKTIHYLYDFGDGWDHAIKIERVTDPEPGHLYPRLNSLQGERPTRGRRRAARLRRLPRRPRRPRPRGPRASAVLVRWRLRPRRSRLRGHHRRGRRPRPEVGAAAAQAPGRPRDPDRSVRPRPEQLSQQSLGASSPSSVSPTDFARPTGSAIRPLRCSRPNASQSNPFHARQPSCSVRRKSASTASLTLSSSISTPRADTSVDRAVKLHHRGPQRRDSFQPPLTPDPLPRRGERLRRLQLGAVRAASRPTAHVFSYAAHQGESFTVSASFRLTTELALPWSLAGGEGGSTAAQQATIQALPRI